MVGTLVIIFLMWAPIGWPPLPGRAAAECVHYDESMHWVGGLKTSGAAQSIVLRDSCAYLADDTVLRVLDIRDAADPRIIGTLDTPGHAHGIDVEGTIALVACQVAGFVLVDVSESAAPAIVGSVDTPGSAEGVDAVGEWAFVADGSAGLRIYNVSQPNTPVFWGTINTSGTSRHLVVVGNFVYLADGTAGLLIIDASDRTHPCIVGSVDTPGEAFWVAIEGGLAYIADGPGGLQVIDISDPALPVIIGNMPTAGQATSVAVDNSVAFVTDYEQGLLSVDASVPENPKHLGTAGVPYQARAVALAGNVAFVAYSIQVNYFSGVQVFDVGILTTQGAIQTLAFESSISNPVVAGQYAYISSYVDMGEWMEGLFSVCDVADPGEMVVAGTLATGMPPVDMAAEGDHAYFITNVDFSSSLFVIDVSEPTVPHQVSVEGVPFYTSGLAVYGQVAYIAADPGLVVVDVSNPLDPLELGTVPLPGLGYDVAVEGTHAYVACGGAGLVVAELSPTSLPVIVGQVQTPSSAISVVLKGDYAYVGDWTPALHVVDIRNPAHPEIVDSVRLPDRAFELAYSNSVVYAAACGCGVQAIDVANPRSARHLGGARPSFAYGVAVAGSFLLQAGDGLHSLPLACSSAAGVDGGAHPALGGALCVGPNPASGQATIRFDLRAGGRVELLILDVAGRRIRRLLDSSLSPGPRTFLWDGRDESGRLLPSGPYVIRMTTGRMTECRKTLLVR